MWVLKPIWAYVNAKCGSRMPGNRSTILNVKAIHCPSNCKPLSEIEQNLFQEPGSTVYWSDGYTMLIVFSLCTFKYWRSLRRTPLGRDSCLPTPGWYGFAHALGTGQVLGWCTCVNCLSPPQRSLCFVGRLGRKKKKACGARWVGKREEKLPPFSSSLHPPCSLYIFFIIAIFIGIPSGSLCRGESVSCCYFCYNRRRYLLTLSSNGVVKSK